MHQTQCKVKRALYFWKEYNGKTTEYKMTSKNKITVKIILVIFFLRLYAAC